jgi:hypothetical protein
MKHERTRNVVAIAILVIAVSVNDPAVAQQMTSRQIEPTAGGWRTWSIASGSAVSVAAPPDAAATRAEIDALKNQLARDGNSLDNVAYWDRGWPGYRWQEIALAELQADPRPNFWRSMALISIAIHDATIATWHAKYQHARPRPSDVDPTIAPAVAVPHSPSYPSDHAAVAAATADVLTYSSRRTRPPSPNVPSRRPSRGLPPASSIQAMSRPGWPSDTRLAPRLSGVPRRIGPIHLGTARSPQERISGQGRIR